MNLRPSFVLGTALLAGALVATSPGVARAGNGTHPRTPVDWSGAPCMTVIDRSQSPIHALSYGIPHEDTMVTPDEVADSRTHQFFTFCEDRHLEEILPGWVTELDVTAAVDAGLGELANVDLDIDVLENSARWAGCWARITGDAERRPITFEAAAEPVMWDTTALPAGTWVVDGYTYEPWFNMWTAHPGVFKIVDDPDPAASAPAAALSFGEQTVEFGDQANISGCVDAMAGSTMSLSYAISGINNEPTWVPFATDVAAESGTFDLAFEPPMETVNNTVMIRLDIEDPMGRSWTAYSRSYVAVTDAVGDTGCDDEGGFVSDPCDEGGSDTGSETGADTGESSTGPGLADEGTTSGCNCTTDTGSRARSSSPRPWSLHGVWSVLVFAGAVRRRRRRLSSR